MVQYNSVCKSKKKNVATRLISLLFFKIPLKFFGPANFDSVWWNTALISAFAKSVYR